MPEFTTIITGLAAGLVAWLALNFFGKPILAIRNARLRAVKVAENYWGVPSNASDNLRYEAMMALHRSANNLMGYDREHSLAKRMLYYFLGWDLWMAARCLRSLADDTSGQVLASEEHKRNLLNALYISLGSTHHLAASELAASKNLIERDANTRGQRLN